MRIVIDGREFVLDRLTGIARVLIGLVGALSDESAVKEAILAVRNFDATPEKLKRNDKVTLKLLPDSFIRAERALSRLTKDGIDCFISPYSKLPIFDTHCPCIHIIHDVLDLTHRAYQNRVKIHFDKFRLRAALAKAELTWYDSYYSKKETEKLIGFSGHRPKIRHLGIEDRFCPKTAVNENAVLDKYGVSSGYILVMGNGQPHKNLGILLENSSSLKRKLLLVGVSSKNQELWRTLCPNAEAIWLSHVKENDLPVILRNAFCLAQPSTAEGYGYPPLEAMACGVPAVISDISVLVETTGGCALPARSSEFDLWQQAFSRLENKAFYASQVRKGLKWVQPLLGSMGWEKHVADVKEVIRNY